MSYISLKDNCAGETLRDLAPEDRRQIQEIAELSISDIRNEVNESLLVFPEDPNVIKDQYSGQRIITFDDPIIRTGNTMGFIGMEDTLIKIHSRFDQDKKDYFLFYLLQKVLQVNLFNLPHASSSEEIFDFLMLLFPYYLKKALSRGLMRQYVSENHNDSSFKGVLDVNRHVMRNIPFNGKIAYKSRQFSPDNPMLKLIKLTIDKILKSKLGYAIINGDTETQRCVREVEKALTNYNERNSGKIISQNLRSKIHPYYSDYEPLRRLCIMILRNERISYGDSEKRIHGILFDGSWLWEEYIAQLLEKSFDHYHKNKGKKFYLFTENGKRFQQIIPDYISKDGTKIGDAKYIPLDRIRTLNSDSATAIYYKTITYMYRFNSDHGLLFFPYPGDEPYLAEYEINSQSPSNSNGALTLIGLPIPSYDKKTDYKTFISAMQRNEEKFLSIIPL